MLELLSLRQIFRLLDTHSINQHEKGLTSIRGCELVRLNGVRLTPTSAVRIQHKDDWKAAMQHLGESRRG